MTTRRRLSLAALSGLLVFAAFPGVGAWPLSFVAWAPLLLALEGASLRAATALGFVAGLCASLPGFRFLYPVLRAQSGLGPVACGLIVLVVAAYHALRGAVIGAVSSASRREPGPPALLFVAGLALSEIAVPSLFPWYFGASVWSVPLLLQPAELGGPVAVSVVLCLSSVAVAETISALRDGRRTRPRVIVPAIAAPIVVALWSSARIAAIDARAAAAPAITVGVVQPSLSPFQEVESVERHRQATEDLVKRGADLVVWAEGAIPWTLPATLVEDAFGTFRLPSVPVLAGAVVEDAATEPGARARHTNSALLFDGGKLVGRYDKHRLLPFSEAMPLEDIFPFLRRISPRTGQFSPGATLSPLHFRDKNLSIFICYEDLFPAHVSSLTQGGEADLLVNLTNDGWFAGTDEPRVHLALAAIRAVEQRRYFVRATLTGVSAIIGPAGRVKAMLPEGTSGTLLEPVRWMRGSTLYSRAGDAPWWLFAAASLGAALLRRRASKAAA